MITRPEELARGLQPGGHVLPVVPVGSKYPTVPYGTSLLFYFILFNYLFIYY